MAEIIWSEPALADLDAIADYIALENPVAASELVKRIFGHIEQLVDHPESGSRPQELGKSRYRQIVEPPCRVFYRYDGHKVFILHVSCVRNDCSARASLPNAPSKQRPNNSFKPRPLRGLDFALMCIASLGRVRRPA